MEQNFAVILHWLHPYLETGPVSGSQTSYGLRLIVLNDLKETWISVQHVLAFVFYNTEKIERFNEEDQMWEASLESGHGLRKWTNVGLYHIV